MSHEKPQKAQRPTITDEDLAEAMRREREELERT